MQIKIEYCVTWNYLPRATSLVAGILDRFGNEVDDLTILPSSGGAYNIWKDSKLIFSKKELGRFPLSDDEVIDQLA